jgi:site-specific recombinase XerD
MSSEIIRKNSPTALSTELAQAAQRAADFVRQSVPENTRRAYAADWSAFTTWCRRNNVEPMPADPRIIAAFCAEEAKRLKPSSIRRRLAAISKMHSVRGLPNPCAAEPVPSTIRGIEGTLGSRVVAKAPATLDVVEQMVRSCRTDTLEGLRNRALILVGYGAALRRSELVGLHVEDLTWSDTGVTLLLRRSKTDQRGMGQLKALPYVEGPMCAAKSLLGWIQASGVKAGPIFRGFTVAGTLRTTALTAQAVAVVVKGAIAAAGLDPDQYSGHSLRAGHVTQARASGVADSLTMQTTGHKRLETLEMYDRRNNPFDKSSAGQVLVATAKK